MSELYRLCTAKNYIYSNWYSDTYRTSMNIGGVTGIRDIRHISIPFDSVKEAACMARNGLSRDEMESFYMSFADEIKRSLEAESGIKSVNDSSPADPLSMLRAGISVRKKADGRGSDIYCIYEPAMQFTSGGYLSGSGASLHSILNLGIYLVGALQAYSASAIAVSSFDIDSLYITADPSGRKSVRNGFIRIDGAQSGRDSVKAALSSICSYMYSMLDGRHYLAEPDTAAGPEYSSEDLAAVLVKYVKGESGDAAALSDALSKALMSLPDRYISFAPPPCGHIDYTPPAHVGDAEAEEDEDGRITESEEDSCGVPFRVKAAAAAAAVLATAAIIVFVTLPMAGIRLFEPKSPEIPLVHSSENGIYILAGSAVDATGSAVPGYSVDSSGNILDESSLEIVYPCGFADHWPAAESLEMTVLSKSFETFPSVSDLHLRSGVLDLRSADCIYDEKAGTLRIPSGHDMLLSRDNALSEEIPAVINQGSADIPLILCGKAETDGSGYDVYTVSGSVPSAADIYYGSESLIESAMNHDAAASEYVSDYLGGQWTYVCMVKAVPDDMLDWAVEVSTDPPYAFVKGADGEGTDSITLNLNEDGCAFFTLVINIHGNVNVGIVSVPGGFSTAVTEAVARGERNPDIPVPPAATAVPAVSPAPQPSAAAVQAYTPAVAYTPAETPLAPPETESPVFGVSADSLLLRQGRSESVTTVGNDCGYISVYSDDPSVAVVDISGGIDGCYTITAIGPGTCSIVFATGESIVRIPVTVV